MIKVSKLAIAIAVATSSSMALAANVAPSQQAPGNIATGQAPQFIAIAFDDNNMPAGQQWVLDTFCGLSNPAGTGNLDLHDGQPLHTTFFNSCGNIDSTAVRMASSDSSRAASGAAVSISAQPLLITFYC